jgi:hypothetical protein
MATILLIPVGPAPMQIGEFALEARLTSPMELRNIALTGLVAAYLVRRHSLGCHPEPT